MWGLSDFTVFSLCVGPLCLGTLRFYGFFAVCGAPVSGDFEILLFFYLCVRTLRVYVFFPYVWGLCVYGDFEILCFSPVCGPCVGDFEIFKKSPIGKNPRCGDLKWQ